MEELDLASLPAALAFACRSDPYLRAAILLQKYGYKAAVDRLLSCPESLDLSSPLFVLCRMLFAAKPGCDFRSPCLGLASYLGDSNYEDWPLSPVEIVNGIPFVIVSGYSVRGSVDSPDRYIRWCVANCVWSEYKFQLPGKEEKLAALASLVASPKWRGRLWADETEMLSAQIS